MGAAAAWVRVGDEAPLVLAEHDRPGARCQCRSGDRPAPWLLLCSSAAATNEMGWEEMGERVWFDQRWPDGIDDGVG
jgi:hypothetical protein